MSEIVPYKGGKTATRGYKARVVSLEFAPGKATKVRLENKLVGSGVCLGCEAPRCKTKDAEELALPALLSAFPGDPSFAVCPTSAIDVSDTSGVAVVDSKSALAADFALSVVRMARFPCIRTALSALRQPTQTALPRRRQCQPTLLTHSDLDGLECLPVTGLSTCWLPARSSRTQIAIYSFGISCMKSDFWHGCADAEM